MMTKHSQMKVIVLKPCVDPTTADVVAPAEIPATGERLYNTTTDALNITDGFGGFYEEFPNSGNPEAIDTATGATSPMKFIQNRDTTMDPASLYQRPLEESQWISPQCFLGVKISQLNASLPVNNMILAGQDASTGSVAVPVLDEFTYRIQVSGHGDREDLYNSVYNTPTVFGTYTSPDWTATAYTAAQSRDITIQSLMYNFNGNNQNIAVGICLSEVASNGSILLTGVINPATFANGAKVIVGYTLAGQAVTIKMDNAIREAFTALDIALGTGTFYLRPYVLAGTPAITAAAPYTVGVIPVAGTTANVENFAMLAIDEGQANFDYRINTKRRITLGLLKGFDSVLQETVSNPEEGMGLGRQLSIMYKANEQYNQTARPQPYMSYHVAFPNEILENGYYDLFFIEHCHQRMSTSGMPAIMPHTTVIACVNHTLGGSALINPYYVAGASTDQKTYLVDALNNFDTTFNLGNAALTV